ncbi:MAG: VCBS repeat-containing protein [Bacteroidales bacterium]|nr:VCBS repeat-containing protein [Bacteroidales bacterium]MBN2817956.1 VCBS repeat-containing protein [Bacteroidales bacterium]
MKSFLTFKPVSLLGLLFILSVSVLGQYCVPTSTYGPIYDTYINGVELEDISNLNTGGISNPTYNNYTYLSTTLSKDSTFSIYITGSPFYSNMHYMAWIDYNRDGNFYGSDEKLGEFITTAPNQINSISFTVPDTSLGGETRLRVLCVWNVVNQDPCGPFAYGEVEDYTVFIKNDAIYAKYDTTQPSSSGTSRWVDTDQDGDMNLSISGRYSTTLSFFRGVFCRNDDGVFSTANSFTAIGDGTHKWFDYDNDGDPDYVFTGRNSSNYTGIYRLDNIDGSGNHTFSLQQTANFEYVESGSLDWGDYDNDGDYDLIICGLNGASVATTSIYTNNNGVFTNSGIELPGIYWGEVQFIDFDVDCDLDVFLSGNDNNGNTFTILLENENGSYSPHPYQFRNMEGTNFAWGDFNEDGYPDLLLNGMNGLSSELILYINDTGESFHESDANLPAGSVNGVEFGDINNDGLLDFFVGINSNNSFFINHSNDSLSALPFTTGTYKINNCEFGDFDNDNDLDIVLNGSRYVSMAFSAFSTKIYKNESLIQNTAPTAPTNLSSNVFGTGVILNWNPSTDNTTNQKSLTYNIYIGTVSQGDDIVSPHSVIPSGKRLISVPGYIQDTCWIIKNLSPGTYYWSVQAIDNSRVGSTFAFEQTFTIDDQFDNYCAVETIHAEAAAWWDFDMDNDQDIFFTIDDTLRIITNTNGYVSWNEDTMNLNIKFGLYDIDDIEPVDFGNDNDIDFLISREFDSLAFLVQRVGSNFVHDSSIWFYNLNDGFTLFADFDNDGDKDLLTSGEDTKVFPRPLTTLLYENQGDTNFTLAEHNIEGFIFCDAVAGDFDGDLDNDIIIYGTDSLDSPGIYLYKNQGNFNFNKIPITNDKLGRLIFKMSKIYKGDFNLDGQPDIFLTGVDSFQNKYSKIYINDNGIFNEANLGLQSWDRVGNYWADWDYDGDLDIIVYSSDNPDVNYIIVYIVENEEIVDTYTIDPKIRK